MGKQPATGGKKTKEAIAKAAAARSKSGAKKKWTKGRVKDKVVHDVFFTPKTYEKFLQEAAKMKFISVSSLVDKCKISGALARKAIRHLKEKQLATMLGDHHHSQYILTTSVKKQAAAEVPDTQKKQTKKATKGKQKKGEEEAVEQE